MNSFRKYVEITQIFDSLFFFLPSQTGNIYLFSYLFIYLFTIHYNWLLVTIWTVHMTPWREQIFVLTKKYKQKNTPGTHGHCLQIAALQHGPPHHACPSQRLLHVAAPTCKNIRSSKVKPQMKMEHYPTSECAHSEPFVEIRVFLDLHVAHATHKKGRFSKTFAL